ncbi:hypothetical protein HN371_23130 [Candidatus Poribacteria bacterium]|jgi:HEAT repeat protein/ectoine hydroxylase-related dioxygenase (phytanoyl-CoA dioxygenase family)|nr:hypothetical protein [Candidatus Poribacteria bacterium]MBT5536241.1 hypothetical protein [Candidatus Poribacteria bacterium]MBT7808168.1 hypothetical protein [Candidatus Poribacteria bacterium]
MMRLDDAAMQRFVRDGYVILKPGFSDAFNETVRTKIDGMLEKHGNPQNNLLPHIPEIQDIFDHAMVDGAMASILGDDYYLHLHRHMHGNTPGSEGQRMHKDSLHNSRFAVDDNRRHHHTRWTMAFYYPQDTPVEIGPTAIIPKSQYLNTRQQLEDEAVTPVAGEAGTVCIVHYDLLHGAMPNTSEGKRYMVKFLFTRMSEPEAPSWDHSGARWDASGDEQERTWEHLWHWHGGANGNTSEPTRSVAELAKALAGDSEAEGVDAAYQLGYAGEEAVPVLIDALRGDSVAARRNAGYAFTVMGQEAVDALVDASADEDPDIRARAVDALGDMGEKASDAVPALVGRLGDESEIVRRHATEALGTAAQKTDAATMPLAAMLNDENDVVRRNAALALARIGDLAAEAVPALTEALREPHYYVRGFSVQALRRIATPEATAALLHYLEATRWDSAQ